MGKPEAPVKPDVCTAESCKKTSARFGFCNDHFEEFKFGLVKKDGKKAADYEKKLEQFLLFKKKSAQKVA